MKTKLMSRTVLVSCLLTLPVISLPAAATPLCSGPTSVADLGTQGCTFNNLTFSDFSFSGINGNPFSGIPLDPADILITIFDSTLAVNILEREPAIALQVTPSNPDLWRASGLFSSIDFGLNYVVSAVNATFDRYQITGTGIGGSLRGGRFSASMAVDPGSQVVSTGSLGPYLQIGQVMDNANRIEVRTRGGASQGIAPGGSTFISSVTNLFSIKAAPVPAPGTLSLGLLGVLLLRQFRSASQTGTHP